MSERVITEHEKHIYNSYLAALGKANNRPFRPRENFDSLKDEVYVELKKLGSFFNEHRVLSFSEFFFAPFAIHEDETYKDLGFYNTPDAVKAYTRYQKVKNDTTDEEKLLEYTKNSFGHILRYCDKNKMSLSEYKTAVTSSDIPVWLVDLKHHFINFYALHALDFREEIYKLDREWREFYVRDFDEIFRKTYTNFSYSFELKQKLKRIKQAIERKLKQYE